MRRSSQALIGALSSWAALLVLAAPAALAADEPTSTGGERPKIGLALSGGGARGFAHVGVLQVLEELRIPIDYIAGTSMGSVVGGVYSAGLSAEQLREIVTTVDWNASFDDRTPRREISFRRKQDSFDFLTSLRLWIRDWKIALPKGLIAGQKLSNLLTTSSLPAATVRDFDELSIPFRAVATDAVSGETVVLDHGELVLAMWASMAVPGIFTPVEDGGRTLVDGGVSNNLPIDVVKAMGADVVIAVDIASPLMGADQVQSAFSIGGQSLTVLMMRNTQDQIALLQKGDFLIKPDLGQLGSASFDAAPELVERGAMAAEEMAEALSVHALSEAEYAAYRAAREVPVDPPVITSLRFDNQSPLDDRVIEDSFDVTLGAPLDVPKLEHEIAALYGEEIFDRVIFGLDQTEDGKQLVIRTIGKEQGRNSLRFGVDLETDFQGESDFNLSTLLTRAPLNRRAGEWRSTLQLGRDMEVSTEWFQPLSYQRRFFLQPSVVAGITRRDYFDDNGDRLATYRQRVVDVEVAIGTYISNWAALTAGVGYRLGDFERTSGDPDLFPDLNFNGAVAFAKFTIDTLDSVTFPRKGGYFSVRGEFASEELGGQDGFDVLDTTLNYAFSFGDTTILPSFSMATTLRADEGLPAFTLGGFLKLSGLPPDARTGSTRILARLIAYHRIANPRVISWTLPVYLGGSVEWGNTFDELGDIDAGGMDVAGSVFIGLDTFLGPIYVAYGHTEGGNNAGYLFLGQVF